MNSARCRVAVVGIGIVVLVVALLQVAMFVPVGGKRLASIEGMFHNLVQDGIVDKELLAKRLGAESSGDSFHDAFVLFGLQTESAAVWMGIVGAAVLAVCGAGLIFVGTRRVADGAAISPRSD